MANLTKLDYFELMDRCHIQLSSIGDHLSGHPALSTEMQYKLDVACEMIYDVYNYAASELHKLETKS